MPASFVFALILLAVLVAVRFITRHSASNEIRRLMTDTKDPDGSREQLRALFGAEEAKDQAHRSELWQQAQTDRGAAKELRRLLLADLEADEEIRRDLVNSGTPIPAKEVEKMKEYRLELVEQLSRVEALMYRLSR